MPDQLFLIVGTAGEVVLLGLFLLISVHVSRSDIRTGKIPTAVVLPGVVTSLGLMVAASFGRDESTLELLLSVIIGGLGLPLVLFLIILLAPGKLGLGDVTLGVLIGAVVGFIAGALGVVLATGVMFVAGGVAAAAAWQRRPGRRAIPFAPHMFLGAWTVIITSLVLR